jgi:hypothetical protein
MRRSHGCQDEVEAAGGKPVGRRQRALQEISSGLVLCLAWGAAGLFLFHSKWVVWPLFFMGGLPVASGIKHLIEAGIAAPGEKRKEKAERGRALELSILRLASERGGILTPALVAMETGMSLDEAQAALDQMAGKGHAELNVLDSGRLEYRFREFERLT